MTSAFVHTPVLLTQSTELLRPHDGGRYIDATVGGGGHAEKVLELSSPSGLLLGIDADPVALRASAARLEPFGDRVTLVERYYDDLAGVSREHGFSSSDGLLFDLGVSSPQLDEAGRGFSFAVDGPLDMRMGPGSKWSAAEIVNDLPENELRRIFFEYGEERFSRRIAQRIARERRTRPILTTSALAEIVSAAKPHADRERIHPATRIFQALRITVNDELGRLSRALPQAVETLRDGGRLVVISFHSLEDRIVKQFMRAEARGCVCPPRVPVCICGRTPRLHLLTSRPVTASPEEVGANPRARSAKLRAAERIDGDHALLT